MSFQITIYSKQIDEADKICHLEDSHLLNLASIGQSVLKHGWDFSLQLGLRERRYRKDLVLFSVELGEQAIMKCVNDLAGISDDTWWGIIYHHLDKNTADRFTSKGAKFIIAHSRPSLTAAIRRLNAEKTSNISKYFHDEDLPPDDE